jgi:hypothetical protein
VIKRQVPFAGLIFPAVLGFDKKEFGSQEMQDTDCAKIQISQH